MKQTYWAVEFTNGDLGIRWWNLHLLRSGCPVVPARLMGLSSILAQACIFRGFITLLENICSRLKVGLRGPMLGMLIYRLWNFGGGGRNIRVGFMPLLWRPTKFTTFVVCLLLGPSLLNTKKPSSIKENSFIFFLWVWTYVREHRDAHAWASWRPVSGVFLGHLSLLLFEAVSLTQLGILLNWMATDPQGISCGLLSVLGLQANGMANFPRGC